VPGARYPKLAIYLPVSLPSHPRIRLSMSAPLETAPCNRVVAVWGVKSSQINVKLASNARKRCGPQDPFATTRANEVVCAPLQFDAMRILCSERIDLQPTSPHARSTERFKQRMKSAAHRGQLPTLPRHPVPHPRPRRPRIPRLPRLHPDSHVVDPPQRSRRIPRPIWTSPPARIRFMVPIRVGPAEPRD
jgi:hypothetical protein